MRKNLVRCALALLLGWGYAAWSSNPPVKACAKCGIVNGCLACVENESGWELCYPPPECHQDCSVGGYSCAEEE
jgi:hypothetical protein